MELSTSIRNFAKKLVKTEEGVTAIEYAIVAAGVAAVVMVIFANDGVVQQTLNNVFTTLSDRLENVIGS